MTSPTKAAELADSLEIRAAYQGDGAFKQELTAAVALLRASEGRVPMSADQALDLITKATGWQNPPPSFYHVLRNTEKHHGVHPKPAARFSQTHCSQCGGSFGPGNAGFSHCSDHTAAPHPPAQQAEPIDDEQIVHAGRVFSTNNSYANGKCTNIEFTPARLVAFVRSFDRFPPPHKAEGAEHVDR